jgi:hypothetical protein
MQLERREAIELVLSSRASLLSQVATRLSIYSGAGHRLLKLKRTNLEKVTKELLGSESVTPSGAEL